MACIIVLACSCIFTHMLHAETLPVKSDTNNHYLYKNASNTVLLAQSSSDQQTADETLNVKAPNGVLAVSALTCIFPFWSGTFNVSCMGGPLIGYGFGFVVGKTLMATAFTLSSIALFTEKIPRSYSLGTNVGLLCALAFSGIIWTALGFIDMYFSVEAMKEHYPALKKRKALGDKPGSVNISLFPREQQADVCRHLSANDFDGINISVAMKF